MRVRIPDIHVHAKNPPSASIKLTLMLYFDLSMNLDFRAHKDRNSYSFGIA
jgi:hypothetical protein